MERVLRDNKKYVVGYHTQEWRSTMLDQPIICTAKDAWLGKGYYFWTKVEFAHYWGEDFKQDKTGCYDIYKALLDTEHCLDAVYSEEGEELFETFIDETIEYFHRINIPKPELIDVFRYLAANQFPAYNISGIIYADTPTKRGRHSAIAPLFYKRRVQIVMYDLSTIHNFELHLEEQHRD